MGTDCLHGAAESGNVHNLQRALQKEMVLIPSLLNVAALCKGNRVPSRPVDSQLKNIQSLISSNNVMILVSFNATTEIDICMEDTFFILQELVSFCAFIFSSIINEA